MGNSSLVVYCHGSGWGQVMPKEKHNRKEIEGAGKSALKCLSHEI